MDEYPGQPPAPQTPPPPTYTPPAAPPVAPPAVPQYAPQQPAAPKKKKTWLFVVLGVVVLGLIACCAISALGGKALFDFASGPSDSLDAMNQAALDNDQAAFDKYFDAQAVAESSYEAVIEYFKGQEDYQTLVEQVGEDEAERIVREEYITKDDWVSEISDSLSLTGEGETDVPFANYTVTSTNIENDTAELNVTADSEGKRVEYVLGFVNEDYKGEKIWRLKEIKNFVDLMEAQGGLE